MPVDIADIVHIVESQTTWRGQHTINLIASENAQSPAVRDIQNSDFMARYAEGHPNTADEVKRYYQGTQYIDEIETIRHHLGDVDADRIVRPPSDCVLEGGDVVVLDATTVLVGLNQRSNRRGYEFLRDYLAPRGMTAIPVPHSQLHLDCCLAPLGLGHLLIHPDSLADNDEPTWRALEPYRWIEVDAVEREHLATNVLSIDPTTVIARNHGSCARVNRELKNRGYRVEEIDFDGVPATGGAFRCASLAMIRSAD